MIRLFVTTDLTQGTAVPLSENQTHYLLHVMRLKQGETLAIFNGRDGEWLAEVKDLTKRGGSLHLVHQQRHQEAEKPLILCPALIKKENMDWVFQKATELGVTEIYPLITERTVVSKLNRDRAQAIVTEAAEQCERLSVPVIHEPIKLKGFLENLKEDIRLICLSERGQTAMQQEQDQTAAFCIGPEGGWTEAEMKLFEQKKVEFLHIGNTILRAETAAVVALAYAQIKG